MDKKKIEGPKESNTLLDSFFIQKLKEAEVHIKPQRKGTPRGEPIGFTFVKYSAALLCLKEWNLKKLAENLKVSYGLLRKWRTEDAFWDLNDKLKFEFADLLIKHLEKRGKRQKELADKYFAKSIKHIAKTPPPKLGWDEFLDLKWYDQLLVFRIVGKIIKYMEALQEKVGSWPDGDDYPERIHDLSILFQCEQFLDILKGYPFRLKKDQEKHLSVLKNEEKLWRQRDYTFLIASLALGSISEEERKRLIYTAHSLMGKFSEVDMDCPLKNQMIKDWNKFKKDKNKHDKKPLSKKETTK